MSVTHLDPADLSAAERYKLLIGCVTPRPIAFVTTVNVDGVVNLAPFSFFAGVGANPLTLLFCPANNNDGSEKDSLRNARPAAEGGVGSFVVNAASESYAREVAAAAEPLPHEESEVDLTGLAVEPSRRVLPPRLATAPWSMECRTRQIIRLAPGEPGGANIVIGDVVGLTVVSAALNERRHVDPAVIRTIGRMGGRGYSLTRQRFELPVGRAALDEPDPIPPRTD